LDDAAEAVDEAEDLHVFVLDAYSAAHPEDVTDRACEEGRE
jgi:hypothetical protein